MRVLCVFVFAVILLTACTDRVICPAFQSAYILDDSTRTAFYSYAWKLDESTRQQYIASLSSADTTQTDSLGRGDAPSKNNWSEYYAYAGRYVQPREEVRKTKYGIVKREPHWLKKYKLRSAPMVNVYGPEREQSGPVDEGEFFASDFNSTDSLGIVSSDSLALDSTAVVAKVPESVQKKPEQKYRFRYDPKDNFNAEQDYYNKYFGKLLLDNRPDPQPAPVDSLANQTAVPDSLQTNNKKGLGGLFKKKKKKRNDDPEAEETPPVEGDPAEETTEEGDPDEGGVQE